MLLDVCVLPFLKLPQFSFSVFLADLFCLLLLFAFLFMFLVTGCSMIAVGSRVRWYVLVIIFPRISTSSFRPDLFFFFFLNFSIFVPRSLLLLSFSFSYLKMSHLSPIYYKTKIKPFSFLLFKNTKTIFFFF
jgi:hypothetical protein